MISVVIPHLNQPEALERGLACLSRQTGLSHEVEIIVVDNGSKTSPADICNRFSGVRLLHQPVPGPGPARNMGVAAASGTILAFVDADCLPAPDWLSAIATRFAATPQACILGGDVRILLKDPARPTWIEAYESVFAFRMKKYIKEKGFTGGGNLAVRAHVFRRVGDFLGITIAEDTEWGQRASRLGYRVRYEPAMIVYHPARRSFAELCEKWDRHIAHDFNDIRAKPLGRWRWLLRAGAVLVSPVPELARIAVSDRLPNLRARALAVYGVLRVRTYRARKMFVIGLGGGGIGAAARWNRQ